METARRVCATSDALLQSRFFSGEVARCGANRHARNRGSGLRFLAAAEDLARLPGQAPMFTREAWQPSTCLAVSHSDLPFPLERLGIRQIGTIGTSDKPTLWCPHIHFAELPWRGVNRARRANSM